MFRSRLLQWSWTVCLIGLLLCLGSQSTGQPRPPAPKGPPPAAVPLSPTAEPLDKLRHALRIPIVDPGNRDELAFRKTSLEKALKNLGPAEVVPALNLQEWRDQDRDDAVAAVDLALRRALIKDFGALVAETLKKSGQGTVDRKLATLTLLGRMGVSVRGESAESNLASGLGPVVIAALGDDDGEVRQRAARTLGKIHSQPEPAVAALTKLLGSKEAGERRAAADALAEMARLVERLGKNRVHGNFNLELPPAQIVQEMVLVINAAGKGLNDADGAVKRSCLEALQLTAKIARELEGDLPSADLFPPAGRKPSPAERKQLQEFATQLSQGRKALGPLVQALNEQVKGMVARLAEPDQVVLLAACQALEDCATARTHTRHRTALVAGILPAGEQKPPADSVLDGLQQAIPALAGLVGHAEVRVRLGAIYVLETLEAEAVPAAPALVKACTDADAFVRWGAVRALGKIAPAEAKTVVHALAKLGDDPNGDVRITALAALERYGPNAGAAVPALGQAAAKGDPPTRIWAMRALAAIGKDAQAAVPALVTALAATEPEIRTAAARTLGKVGQGSADARKALRKALDDPSGEVQEAASQALLAVQ